MHVTILHTAQKQLEALSPSMQRSAYKQFDFLKANVQHPSLNAKKYDEREDIWQARINKNYRFYFIIAYDTYYILRVTPHPK